MNKKSLHKTRWSGHAFGTCLVRHEDKLVYVNIPKNATEWMKDAFGGERENFFDNPFPDDYQYLVVLREPHKRLISGICEWLKRYTPIWPENEILDNADVLSLLLGSGGSHDEHTELQARFIDGIPRERITFFKCDENLKDNWKDWAEKNNPGLVNRVPDHPKHQTDGPWKARMEKLEQAIKSKRVLAQRVESQLKIDNRLFKSVQFYNK